MYMLHFNYNINMYKPEETTPGIQPHFESRILRF